MGGENDVLQGYKDDLLRARGFYGIPRIEYDVYHKTDRIDLSDPAIQALISVDYLTQNDTKKRKEPWRES